ncbi:N-acetyl-D-Glu racemase DgcA [Novosphingobium sp. 9]|uniref:N-acetyl-D-Glu racemase DgcA n=1 Tax=Novosphingobium sp. 9 TaxID=2025349 RepID=UPI0021B5216A|nr:N-acetyl-D-Glu racemase DgcA [Novosphingobium sp. 9]
MSLILDARAERFALARPFRISRGVKTEALVVTASVSRDGLTGQTLTGWGEGVPYARYGESVESVLAQIEEARGAIERGLDRAGLAALLPAGAARNALDCALWDLEAKASGISVADQLGIATDRPVASALTVVIDTPEAMAAEAAKVAHAPLLKVKVDALDPEVQVRAVRAAAPEAALIVDPNESWDEALVRAMAPVLADCRVAVLEQPVPAEADDWLAGYCAPVPICADESLHTLADLPRIAERYQAINVKLDKAGGLTEALALVHAARARNMGLMVGCMVSSSLSIVPALHIAAVGKAGADWVDLDGPVWLREDRHGGVRDEGGYLLPPQQGFWGS